MRPAKSPSDSTQPCRSCQSAGEKFRLFTGYSFDQADDPFEVVRCGNCGLAHVSPLLSVAELGPYYSSDYYGDGGNKKFWGPVEWFAQSENRGRIRNILRFLKTGISPRVLDIGCGRAGFLKAFAAHGADCVGLDIPGFPFPEDQPRLSFVHGTGDHLPFEDGSFDAVSIWQVLEHTQDPRKTTHEIARVLKPGGVLAVAVPNFGSFQARLFGKHWFHLDLPRHLFHFTPSVLVQMLEDADLEPLEVSTWSLHQNLYGFVQSFLNQFFPRIPNRLFALIKGGGQKSGSRLFASLPHLVVGGLIFPFAVLDSVLGVLFSSGATLMIHARKRAPEPRP